MTASICTVIPEALLDPFHFLPRFLSDSISSFCAFLSLCSSHTDLLPVAQTHMYWVECGAVEDPQKDMSPATCKYGLIWKIKNFCRCNYVKDCEVRSFWITQVVPRSMSSVLIHYKKEDRCTKKRPNQRPKGEGHVKIRVMHPQAKNTSSHQKL